MKITVLQGSPNRDGSTAVLIENFMKGAQESGHTVSVIDTAHGNISSCTGCVACGYEGPCIQQDDIAQIREEILTSDMIVFATPMSAQLKTVIDRFCAVNASIQRKHMKSALLAVAWNSDDWTFEALNAHYRTLVRYLNLEDQGVVLGAGCGTPSMTRHSRYPKEALRLGKSLK